MSGWQPISGPKVVKVWLFLAMEHWRGREWALCAAVSDESGRISKS